MRTGPRAFDGSTTRPFCIITTFPDATSRRAAIRVRSIIPLHASASSTPTTARAASLGQIVPPLARPRKRAMMVSSIARSVSSSRVRLHFSEQYRTDSQSRSHFFRQTIRRPQHRHAFSLSTPAPVVTIRPHHPAESRHAAETQRSPRRTSSSHAESRCGSPPPCAA